MESKQIGVILCPLDVPPPYKFTNTFSAQEDLEDKNSSKNQDLSLVLQRGVILTKDNVAKKNWKGSLK
jgi:hypothetical protein